MRLTRMVVGLALFAALMGIVPGVRAQGGNAPARAASAAADTDETRIAELITANHILAARGIIDARGHISVRSVKNPKHFFMSRVMPPAEMTRADVVELDENSKPVDPAGASVYSERFIHGEIYRRRPDVQSVVHAHPVQVLPFTVTQAPFQAIIHTAYFLGAEPAPIFDLRSVEGDDNRMLVTNNTSGAALAAALGTRSVVLMRGHGMAVAAPSVRDAVFRSVYTIINAEVELQALSLGKPVFLNKSEVKLTEWIDPFWDIWKKEAEGRATSITTAH